VTSVIKISSFASAIRQTSLAVNADNPFHCQTRQSAEDERAGMHTYRCYLLDLKRPVVSVEMLECTDDDDARQQATAILAARNDCSAIEVWQRGRQVAAQQVVAQEAD
jgi:hypothetical protein